MIHVFVSSKLFTFNGTISEDLFACVRIVNLLDNSVLFDNSNNLLF